jgi:hypothetical protein
MRTGIPQAIRATGLSMNRKTGVPQARSLLRSLPIRSERLDQARFYFLDTRDDGAGRIFEIREPIEALREPAKPISAAITALTGITDEMVDVSIKAIVRLTGRGLVRRVLRGQRSDVFRVRRVRSNSTCHGSTRSGLLVIVTAPTCGVASRRGDLGVRCGSFQNGRHAVGAPKRPMLGACRACRPRDPSPGS